MILSLKLRLQSVSKAMKVLKGSYFLDNLEFYLKNEAVLHNSEIFFLFSLWLLTLLNNFYASPSVRGWLASGMKNNSPPLHDWLAHFITKGPSTSSFGSAMHDKRKKREKKESHSLSASA
jgi:hypothetical protein